MVVVVVASSGAGPLAKQPKCGDTITTDTTLHHNLVNCPNNGIIIGADNITLDLNYHTIDGDGTPGCRVRPPDGFCDVGVANFGHDGVTVVHGSLRQFGGGVDFGGALRHNRLLDISSSRNADFGIQVFSCCPKPGPKQLRNRHHRPRGHGMGLFGSHHVRVLNSSFRHNAGHHGIHRCVDSNHNLIKGNRVLAQRRRGHLWRGASAIGSGATAWLETAPASPSAPAAIT